MDTAVAMAWRLGRTSLRPALRRVCGVTRIEQLDLPPAVVAADMITQREVALRRGLSRLATLASLSIPGVYPPQHSGPYTLVDGGVRNPVPSNIAADAGSTR
jgi:NTE family protein